MSFNKLLLVMLFASGICSSQQVRLSGVVKDSLTGAPLSGVIVSLPLYAKSDTTDQDGAFSLEVTSVRTQKLSRPGTIPYVIRNGSLTVFINKRRRKFQQWTGFPDDAPRSPSQAREAR